MREVHRRAEFVEEEGDLVVSKRAAAESTYEAFRHNQPSGDVYTAAAVSRKGVRQLSTTSLITGVPAEKGYIEWFLEGKSRSVGPIL